MLNRRPRAGLGKRTSKCGDCVCINILKHDSLPEASERCIFLSKCLCLSKQAHGRVIKLSACRASQRSEPNQLEAQLAGIAGLLTPLLLDVDAASAGNPLLTGKTVRGV